MGRTFNRMLWLNPTDNQGARSLPQAVQPKDVWHDEDTADRLGESLPSGR